ncbi:MAG: hypothetical protein EXR74_10060 [Bdellovibrionales bacterium]|nr:hypothetical protein [Bdellovibrionales bacterium]
MKKNQNKMASALSAQDPDRDNHRPYWQSSLFNEVCLRHDLPRQEFWTLVENGPFATFQNDFINLCTSLRKDRFEDWNEADTIRNWIEPIMKILGWHNKCKPDTNPVIENLSLSETDGGKTKTYRPDLLYVDDPDEKKCVYAKKDPEKRKFAAQTYGKIVLEAKAWQILDIQDRKKQIDSHKKKQNETNKDDTIGLSFDNQCLKYMELMNLEFGILTDGKSWKLFHLKLSNEGGNRRSFDFSLGHAFLTAISLSDDRSGEAWRELTANLKYFFYLFRKESFWPKRGSVTEFLMNYNNKFVSTIEQDLRKSFMAAMTIICNGYKQTISESLTEENLEMIRNVSESHLFNLLFIKSCETTNILPLRNPHYYKQSITDIENRYFDISISRFLDTIEFPAFNPSEDTDFNNKRLSKVISDEYECKFNPDGTEIYDRLLSLYNVVQQGDFGLKIKGFKETVFSVSEWEFAKKFKISNYAMVRLLFQLGYTDAGEGNGTYRQIPYSYFTPRQLGSIYESFLEFTLLTAKEDLVFTGKKWVAVGASNGAKLKAATGTLYFAYDPKKKKQQGSFYTPDYVVRHIVKETLTPLVKGKDAKDILKIRVCDPAAGSGHFLNYALEYLSDNYRLALAEESKGEFIENDSESKRKILQSCLFGTDINPRAIKLCKMGLWLATADSSQPLEPLIGQLRDIDSLGTVWKEIFPNIFQAGGFDATIGNPPWGAYLTKQEIKTLCKRFPDASYKLIDSFKFFFSLAIHNLKKGNGRIGFIIPRSILTHIGCRDLRKTILESQLESAIDLGDNVFEGVTCPSAIIVMGNCQSKSETPFRFTDLRGDPTKLGTLGTKIISMSATECLQNQNCEINNSGLLIELPLSSYKPLRDLAAVFDSGIDYSRKALGDAVFYKSDRALQNGDHAVLRGKNINRFVIQHNNLWLRSNWKEIETAQKRKDKKTRLKVNEIAYRSSPKILVRQTADEVIATLDGDKYYNQKSLLSIHPKKEINPYYLLGVLNSTEMTKQYRSLVQEEGQVFSQVKKNKLEQLRIPVGVDKKTEQKIAALAMSLSQLNNVNNKDYARLLIKLEELVTGLFSVKSTRKAKAA